MERDDRRATRGLRLATGIVVVLASHSAWAQHQRDHSQHRQSTEHEARTHEHPAQPTQSESLHVPPDPPQRPLGDMSNERMIELMGMDDGAAYSMLRIDQLEWRDLDRDDAAVWDAQAFYGDDYNKAWWKFEGSRTDEEYESKSELLWDRIFSRWWSTQLGIRHDANEGPSRTWAAFGVQGLAPHWFEVEATLYVGEQGRTAFKVSLEHDLLLTQRLILQPELEVDLYGKDDPANGIGSGLANLELAFRLRYEIRRELAPYVGVAWTRSYGETADWARMAGAEDNDVQLVAGLRMWF